MEERMQHSELSLISQTEVTEADETDTASAPVLRLRLKKPKGDRKVEWTEGTVDNEDMGKKKSKCCCIYKKPVAFGESSSEEDEECEHCFGHPEKRRKNRKKGQDEGGEGSGEPIPPTDETPTDPNSSLGETGQPPSIVSLEQ